MGRLSTKNIARDAGIIVIAATTAYCLYKTYAQSTFVPFWGSTVLLTLATGRFAYGNAFRGNVELTESAKKQLIIIEYVSAANLTWWAAECLKNSGFVQSFLSTCGSGAPVVSTCINPATLAVAAFYCISHNLYKYSNLDLNNQPLNIFKAPVFSTVCHASILILTASYAPAWVTACGLAHAAGFISALVLTNLFEAQLGML